MRDLEEKTYNFVIQGIGLIKSLEKEFPELLSAELKKSIGAVSTKYMDAIDSKENADFGNNLRESYTNAKKSHELLNSMGDISSQTLNEQRKKLIKEAIEIVDQLNTIIQKLIY